MIRRKKFVYKKCKEFHYLYFLYKTFFWKIIFYEDTNQSIFDLKKNIDRFVPIKNYLSKKMFVQKM